MVTHLITREAKREVKTSPKPPSMAIGALRLEHRIPISDKNEVGRRKKTSSRGLRSSAGICKREVAAVLGSSECSREPCLKRLLGSDNMWWRFSPLLRVASDTAHTSSGVREFWVNILLWFLSVAKRVQQRLDAVPTSCR
jgi:hypothetical protein